MIEVFIRFDRLNLVKWLENNSQLIFNSKWVPHAIKHDAIDIAIYFYYKYQQEVHAHSKCIYKELIDSSNLTAKFMEFKMFFLQKFLHNGTAEEVYLLVHTIKQKTMLAFHPEHNPFVNTLNPIKLALLTIELLRTIRKRFKSLQVICQEIELHLTASLLDFLKSTENEFDLKYLMTDLDLYNRDVYDMISQLELYEVYSIK